jgi:uncharacterized protein (DUF1778 family)
MATQPLSTERRTEKLDIRLSSSAKAKLQAAAAASQRSMTDFVMESALARAEETLADRNTFGLSAEKWEEFLSALNAQPRPLPRLSVLLENPGFFNPASGA